MILQPIRSFLPDSATSFIRCSSERTFISNFSSRCPSPSVLYGAFYRFPRCLHLSLSPFWTSFHYCVATARGNLPPPRVPSCFIALTLRSWTLSCKSSKVSQPFQRDACGSDSLCALNPTGIARSIS